MVKLPIFFALALGVIISTAQFISHATSDLNEYYENGDNFAFDDDEKNEPEIQRYQTQPWEPETSSTWNYDSREIGDNGEEQNPSIGCILFGDTICFLYCYLSIDVYYQEINTVGRCDDTQSCLCHYEVEPYLPFNWSMRFDADYVYWAIVGYRPLFNYVKDLFNKPFKTAEEYKKKLRPHLSPYQYYKLQIRDNSIASMLFKNGKIDENLVRKYVSDQLQRIFDPNSVYKYAFYTNYEQNFRNALKNVRDEGTIYNIAFEVSRLRNKKLGDILKEHLATNKLQLPNTDFDDSIGLEAALYHAITTEIIKQRDQMIVDPEIAEATYKALNS